MRTGFLAAGIALLLLGAGVVFYQLSESCEENGLETAHTIYPWCNDILDHVNLTFIGVLALFAALVLLALGGPLHWLLEPSREDGEEAGGQSQEIGSRT
jgi:hypothetical protein